MARKLTDKQMQTLRFIYDYIKANDCAPTMKEIKEGLGINLNAVSSLINPLIGHGCLRKSETGQWGRSIALTEKGILACGRRL